MKINEKNLIYFATSDTPIDREGWLLKRGDVNKSFQKRWFVLKGNLLFYFDKRSDKEPVGVIILEGCTIELAENEEQYTFKVVFHGAGGRTYILGADTQETMESWMKALACASYDYMKLMVAELQRQMDELAANEKLLQPPPITAAVKAETIAPIPPPRQQSSKQTRRVNPFNRCKSDEDVDQGRHQGGEGLASSKARLWQTHSVPNTPVPTRPAPPPPIAVAGAALTHHQVSMPNMFHEHVTLVQTSSSAADFGRGGSGSNGSIHGAPRKTFHELHEQYGQRIRHNLHKWQQERQRTPTVNATDQLVQLD